MGKVILDLCGGTGAWSKPYKDNGYEVVNVTLPDNDILNESVVKWCIDAHPYGILFAPPCTVWANSGARWWNKRSADELFESARILVKGLRIIYNSDPVFWALENPVGKMREFLGYPVLIFHPCDYGDPYTKKTLLWGKFKPPLMTKVQAIEGSKIRYGGKTERTKQMRSVTPQGFAQAFFEANR
jgi:hypothetical protein